MQKKLLSSIIFIILFLTPAKSEIISGNAIIIDGDTIRINNKKIRLHGIDAPEIKQLCQKVFLSILDISSNHIYAFTIISFFGLYIYFQKYLKLITIYLIFISVVLEILHIIIPNRSFQFSDLIGNLLGVFIMLILFYTYFNAKKTFK